MKLTSLLELPLITYSFSRSACFSLEYRFLSLISSALPKANAYPAPPSAATLKTIQSELQKLLIDDSKNITSGVYPISVLKPESPIRHVTRIPKIISDGVSIYWRRRRGRTTEFQKEAREWLNELPRYYRRNFHFQTDGYLSKQSAELYEHQVEMLFGGAADAMRRLIIPALREKFGSTDGKGLTFLEIGAGTGRASRFVHLAFPKAKIVVSDLSEPYLKVAQKRLKDLTRLDFIQAEGEDLPFEKGHFDAVYSVFLFHELPMEARKKVIAESRRVLKEGGFLGLVDSVQTGDLKDFDVLLENFPKDFHEPFYRNYADNPMQDLLAEAKIKSIKTSRGFFSKVCWGQK